MNPPPIAPARRWPRIAVRVGAGLAALLVLSIAGVLGLLGNLERAFVKGPLTALVRERSGVSIDYADARVRPSGAHVSGLVVDVPGTLRAEVGTLEVGWRGTRDVRVRGLVVTLPSPNPAPAAQDPDRAEPTEPLGKTLRQVLGERPPIDTLQVDDVTLVFVRPAERFTVRGLALRVTTAPWRVSLGEGDAATLLVERTRADQVDGTARGVLALSVSGTPEALTAKVGLRLLEQTLAPDAPRLTDVVSFDAVAKLAPAGDVSLEIAGAQLADGALRLDAHLALPGDAREAPRLVESRGHADLRALLAVVPGGVEGVALKEGRVDWRVANLALAPAAHFLPGGEATLSGRLARLTVPGARIESAKIELAARANVAGGAPDPRRVELTVQADVADVPKLRGPVAVEATARELAVDLAHPVASTAKGTVVLRHGGIEAKATFEKETDAVAFTATAEGGSLALLKPIVGPLAQWESMGLSLRSRGAVRALATSPQLEHETEVVLSRPASAAGARPVSAETLALRVQSKGDARSHVGELEAKVKGLRVGQDALGDSRSNVQFALDGSAPSLALKLTSEGAPGQTAAVDASLALDRARRRITARFSGTLLHPVPLAPVLAPLGLDPEPLEVEVAGRGTLDGVLAGVAADGTPRWVRDPMASAEPEGSFEARVKNLSWARDDQELTLPELTWIADVRGNRSERTLRSDLDAGAFELLLGEHTFSGANLHQSVTATWRGAPAQRSVQVLASIAAASLTQDYRADYPMRGVQLTFEANRDPRAFVRIPRIELENAGGGTTARLRGALDLGSESPRLVLRGELSQDLARVSGDRARFEGSGLAKLSMRLSSANLRTFRLAGTLEVKGGNVHLPASGVRLETVDGEVPLNADVAFDGGEVRLLRESRVNPYPQLRFTDQHPLLSRRSFISIARITTPWVSIAPLAGNLQVAQNVVSISQLEMGVRGGRVTGQCVLDWDGPRTTLQAHVRANDLHSSHGEPFDGNIALVFSARDRGVDGRADILRIGSRHLQDLMDIQDPHHADAAFNRVRKALAFGHPDRVRLSFNRGFASAKVTLGGLARLVNVDEIRGIPVGPLVDRVLAKLELQEEP